MNASSGRRSQKRRASKPAERRAEAKKSEQPVVALAGADSPHLDAREQTQAAEHAAPAAIVIHEVIREEGEAELNRRTAVLAWSGLAAGLSMGFSLLGLAMLQARLPDMPWRPLVDSFGYCIGFVIVILGRQQLFTESTLTAVLPLMVRRDAATLVSLLRMWGVVLAANLIGTIIFAALVSLPGLFTDPVHAAMVESGRDLMAGPLGPKIVKAVLAGWLIALMVWLLPSARSARLFVIILLTYLVGVGRFPHIIAGSAETAFSVFAGAASVGDYLLRFMLPTLIGNTIGGVALVAFLNYVPLATDLKSDG